MTEGVSPFPKNDPDGYVLTYGYDGLNRPVRVTYPDGTYEQTIYGLLDAEEQKGVGPCIRAK